MSAPRTDEPEALLTVDAAVPAEVEAREPVVEDAVVAAAPAFVDDDDMALLGTAAPADAAVDAEGGVTEAEPIIPPRSPSPERCPIDVRLEDLFGDFAAQDHAPIDPKEWDAETLIHEVFGAAMTDMDIFHEFHLETDADDHRISIIAQQQHEENLQACVDVFGENALETLGADLGFGAFEHSLSIATCTLPEDPFEVANRKRENPGLQVWLLEMFKVNPNRQSLHFETEPFHPASASRPESTDRKFFTPQNVIRYVKGSKGQVLSNARVVRWSDGSATLHVGCDVYELRSNQERNLTFLASHTHMKEEDGKERHNTFVEATQVDRHVVAVPAQGFINSVNEGLVHEKQALARRARPQEAVGFLSNAVPVLRNPKEIQANKGPEMTPEEAFMQFLRKKTQQRIEQQRREGIPFTAAQIIAMELDDLEAVTRATEDSTIDVRLAQLREEAKQANNARTVHRAAKTSSKFDRSTALQNLDGSGEAYAYGGEDDFEAAEDDEPQNGHGEGRVRSLSRRSDSNLAARSNGKRAPSESDEDERLGDLMDRREQARPVAPEYQ